MKKLIIALLTLIFIFYLPLSAMAAEEPLSLSIVYKSADIAFEGLNIETYKIANILDDGSYELCNSFAGLPVSLDGIMSQSRWKDICETLWGFAVSEGIEPDLAGVTDSEGCVSHSGLSRGIYMTLAQRAEQGGATYTFETFLTVLSGMDENGNALNSVTAYPKSNKYIPQKDETEYKVLKLWNDADANTSRPEKIEVQIWKDGALFDTVSLSSENNWCFTWKSEDSEILWQVTEKNVAEGYTVEISRDVNTFVLINTHKVPDGGDSPQTGDYSVAWPYIIIVLLCGGASLALAIRLRRSKRV